MLELGARGPSAPLEAQTRSSGDSCEQPGNHKGDGAPRARRLREHEHEYEHEYEYEYEYEYECEPEQPESLITAFCCLARSPGLMMHHIFSSPSPSPLFWVWSARGRK